MALAEDECQSKPSYLGAIFTMTISRTAGVALIALMIRPIQRMKLPVRIVVKLEKKQSPYMVRFSASLVHFHEIEGSPNIPGGS